MEGHLLGASSQFDTFGFTATEISRKQAEKEQQQRFSNAYDTGPPSPQNTQSLMLINLMLAPVWHDYLCCILFLLDTLVFISPKLNIYGDLETC